MSNQSATKKGFTPLHSTEKRTEGGYIMDTKKSITTFKYAGTVTGFTLVESLVAITILLLVIIGPMTAAQKGTQNAYFAREQLTAVFLAQEAIEAVREIRDTRAIDVYDDSSGDTSTWTSALSTCDMNDCAYNPSASNIFATCGTINNQCTLLYDSQAGTYGYTSGESSPYTRKVHVDFVDNNNDGVDDDGVLPVTVNVSWNNQQVFGGATKDVQLQTWIYDQYKRYE